VTVVAFASVKGAPGVTTVASLVAATWPEHRKVMMVESDPSGGDLAARFGLSSKCGWSSFVAASRRSDSTPEMAPHLQQLPGGLDVLVGPRSPDSGDTQATADAIVTSAASNPDEPWDVLVDLGRLLPGVLSAGGWLNHSDVLALVLGSDAASVLHMRDRAAAVVGRCKDRVGLIVVRSGDYCGSEIERFTGIPVIGEIPFDPAAAAVATGGKGSDRRLSRSLLVASAFRLAATLSRTDTAPADQEHRQVAPTAERRESSVDQAGDQAGDRADASRRIWKVLIKRTDSSTSAKPSRRTSRQEVLR
jgi:hypothetical protein